MSASSGPKQVCGPAGQLRWPRRLGPHSKFPAAQGASGQEPGPRSRPGPKDPRPRGPQGQQGRPATPAHRAHSWRDSTRLTPLTRQSLTRCLPCCGCSSEQTAPCHRGIGAGWGTRGGSETDTPGTEILKEDSAGWGLCDLGFPGLSFTAGTPTTSFPYSGICTAF